MKTSIYVKIENMNHQVRLDVPKGTAKQAIQELMEKGVADEDAGMVTIYPPHRILSIFVPGEEK